MGNRRTRSEPAPPAHLSRRAALAALLGLLPACGLPLRAAEAMRRIEVFELRHQTAAELIPIVAPLLADGSSVTGAQDRLIVNGTDAELDRLREVLAQLDRPLRRLRISVRQRLAGSADQARLGIGGDIVFQSESGRGPAGDLRIRSLGTRSERDSEHLHFVQAVEGRPAFIQTGVAVPIANRQITGDRYGTVVQDSIELRELERGFYVTPQLAGDTVTLYIAPRLERLAPDNGGIIELQGAETVVSGPLGSWLAIGGAGEAAAGEQRGVLARTRRAGEQHYQVEVKVEELR